jgi:hypothetical protein
MKRRQFTSGKIHALDYLAEIGRNYGSEQESVNTCVFAGFLSDRVLGPPMPPHIVHVRCRQCFPAFRDIFHVRTWPRLLSLIHISTSNERVSSVPSQKYGIDEAAVTTDTHNRISTKPANLATGGMSGP